MVEVKYTPVPFDKNQHHSKLESAKKKPDTLFLRFTVLTALLVFISAGTSLTWPSPAISKLLSNNTEVNPLGRPITTYEISLLISIPLLGSPIGSLTLPTLADFIGRKKSLQYLGLGMLLSAVGLAFSNRVYLYVASCLAFSIFFCGIWGIFPMYIAEICEDHNRAKYGCLLAVCTPIGQLYTYVVGSFFSLTNFTLLTTFPLLPYSVFFFFLAESPVYCLKNGRTDECRRILKKLRCNKSDKEIDADIIEIRESLSTEIKTMGAKNLFTTKAGRVGVMFAMLPTLTQIFSGVPVMLFVLGPLFQETDAAFSGDTVAIIVGIVQAISSLLASLIIEKTGRKPLLVASSIGSGIAVCILGTYYYLKQIRYFVTDDTQWVLIMSVLAYVIFFSIGLGPIPMAIISELFLPEIRSAAVSFIITLITIVWGVYAFSFPLLVEMIGRHWCFWLFSICCFIGATLMQLLLPETKGKTILELQELMKNYKW